ncbi:hypothetical protein C8F01DRAFT_1235281 [Mycena amicta]|nr:hypothetical protein C8F01DRAFT_1235281 [Mycena amicta]
MLHAPRGSVPSSSLHHSRSSCPSAVIFSIVHIGVHTMGRLRVLGLLAIVASEEHAPRAFSYAATIWLHELAIHGAMDSPISAGHLGSALHISSLPPSRLARPCLRARWPTGVVKARSAEGASKVEEDSELAKDLELEGLDSKDMRTGVEWFVAKLRDIEESRDSSHVDNTVECAVDASVLSASEVRGVKWDEYAVGSGSLVVLVYAAVIQTARSLRYGLQAQKPAESVVT